MTNEPDIEKEREELRRLRDLHLSHPAEDALSDPRVQRRLCLFIANVILDASRRAPKMRLGLISLRFF